MTEWHTLPTIRLSFYKIMTRYRILHCTNLIRRVYHYVRLCYHIISIKFVKATRKMLFDANLKLTYSPFLSQHLIATIGLFL